MPGWKKDFDNYLVNRIGKIFLFEIFSIFSSYQLLEHINHKQEPVVYKIAILVLL